MGCLCFGKRKGNNDSEGARYNQAENATTGQGSVALPDTVLNDTEKLDARARNVKEIGLTQLSNPAAEIPSAKKYNMDIVAVHGLGGHPFKSWTFNEKGKECFWLEDYLLKDLPGARVFTFGYNSNPFFSRSVQGIGDFAKELIDDLEVERLSPETPSLRPIVFICHSMGGLVCKKFLIRANEDPRYLPLLNAIKAIFFFGTPHRGSKLANTASVIAPILNIINVTPEFLGKGKLVRSDLIEQLEAKSQQLKDLSESFVKRTDNLTHIVSFSENLKVRDRLIVTKDSCTIGVSNENVVPLPADHVNMCRIESRGDKAYRIVLRHCKEIATEVLNKHTIELDKKQQQCLETLAIPTFTATLAPKTPPAEDTCKWLLSVQEYNRWRDGLPPILWISGKSGCGKSTLLHFLRQSLLEYRTTMSNTASNSDEVVNVCSFFCDNRNGDLATNTAILRGLIWDLLSRRHDLIHHVLEDTDYKQSRSWSYPQLLRIFQAVLNDPVLGNACVIIDALDECDPNEIRTLLGDLGNYIERLPRTRQSRITFVISSHAKLPPTPLRAQSTWLALDDDETLRKYINTDIQRYVKASLRFSRWFPNHEPGYEERLEDWTSMIVTKSEGSFLWTTLVLDRLGKTISGHKAIFDECPPGVSNIYYSSLAELESKDHQQVVKAFNIIFAAKSPLTRKEFKAAMCVGRHHHTLRALEQTIDEDGSWFLDPLPAVLGNLIQVVNDRITFCHNAVKDFLLKLAEKPIPNGNTTDIRGIFRLSKTEAERTLASCCMAYLNLGDFTKKRSSTELQAETWAEAGLGGLDPYSDNVQESPVANEQDHELDGDHHPFLEYAASNWGSHYALSESSSDELMSQACKLCTSDRGQHALDNWSSLFRKNYWGPANLPMSPNALLVAAYFDQVPLAQKLAVDDEYSLRRVDALAWASRMGSPGVVDVLTGLGVSCTENVLESSSAFCWAAAGGFLKIVNAFIKYHEESVNAKNGNGCTPLMMAVSNTRVEVVRRLLEVKAIDLKTQCPDGKNAFLYVNVGRTLSVPEGEILRMLLEEPSIDITARDKRKRSIVSYAAEYGNTGILEAIANCRERRKEWEILLDDDGGDGQNYRPPFIWAAWKGKFNVVKYFGDSNQAVSMFQKLYKFEHENAFSLAAQYGHIDIIRYLAERFPAADYPAGINIRNKTGRTPISIAMWEPRTETIKVLLECGADPNIADDGGRTPWSHGHDHPHAQEALIKYSKVGVVRSHGPEYHPKARVIDGDE